MRRNNAVNMASVTIVDMLYHPNVWFCYFAGMPTISSAWRERVLASEALTELTLPDVWTEATPSCGIKDAGVRGSSCSSETDI